MAEVTWTYPAEGNKFYAKIEIAGVFVSALIDTGSNVTIINEGLAQLFH